MLKRWVFNARRKAGCESMSLMSVSGETVPDGTEKGVDDIHLWMGKNLGT